MHCRRYVQCPGQQEKCCNNLCPQDALYLVIVPCCAIPGCCDYYNSIFCQRDPQRANATVIYQQYYSCGLRGILLCRPTDQRFLNLRFLVMMFESWFYDFFYGTNLSAAIKLCC